MAPNTGFPHRQSHRSAFRLQQSLVLLSLFLAHVATCAARIIHPGGKGNPSHVLRVHPLMTSRPSSSASSSSAASKSVPGANGEDTRANSAGNSGGTQTLSQVLGSADKQGSLTSWPGLQGGQAGAVTYGGGPLMTRTIVVHFIFYGDWKYANDEAGQGVLAGFVRSLNEDTVDDQGPTLHKWWQIATQYTDSSGTPVASKVLIRNCSWITENYKSHLDDGTSGTNDDIFSIVQEEIAAKRLPLHAEGFYAVLTSGEITVGDSSSGFCGYPSGYCGWHTQNVIDGVNVQYAMIGDGTVQCNSGCGANAGLSQTANGKYAMDSLLSILAHELVETATDPDTVTGYTALDQDGSTRWEIADLCNGLFYDQEFPLRTGGFGTYAYNLLGVNGLKFLIQTNVDLATQACVLNLPGSASGTSSPPGHSSPADPGVSPPPPPPEGNQQECGKEDRVSCLSCSDPEGCQCFNGTCLPLCEAAAKSGYAQECSGCFFFVCFCTSDGTCKGPFGF